MDVACAVCGTSFTSTRSNAKYCSDRCKKRSARASRAAAKTAPGAVAATRREIDALHMAGTPEAEIALALARVVDEPGANTASALAAAGRELRQTLVVLRKAGIKEADPVDELAKRRAGRRRVS